ncbi:UPF0415 protein C7orf25 homolog [Ruditapes philippinarum]|uniref:UPF0415 protein C7orf25 homolog n=1 Tax=Ruditapes philippinarum TaxID=129788 RepID=UPI00295B7FF5|nr:UPF0415 protein C7orf25 homolog [Ruditapes philippinarum]XP_060575093.1 UPF0415 protein C7orf25 homolog [Ruditapes philippinarum]
MAEAAFYSTNTINQTALLNGYMECAETLIEKCKELSDVTGASKLERKCAAELKYLKSLARRRGGFDITNLRSSNLSHYAGVLHSADNLQDVTHILQAFSCPGRTEALHMDVVAGQGHIWVKVVARKAQALHLIWRGQGQYGEKDITIQAKDFVACSKVHPVNFQDPKIVFAFYNGVTAAIARELEKSGVIVLGEIVPVDDDVERKLMNLDDESESDESDSDYDTSDDDNDVINDVILSCKCSENNIAFRKLQQNCLKCGKPYESGFTPDISSSDGINSSSCTIDQTIENKNKCHNSVENSVISQNTDDFISGSSFSEEEQISEIVSSNQSEALLTDSSSKNKREKHPIDSDVNQASNKHDCSTLNSIDSRISQIALQDKIRLEMNTASDGRSLESNHMTFQTDNMPAIPNCPEKKCNDEIDTGKNLISKNYFNLDKWKNTSVLSFVQSELLLNPVVDFHSIRHMLADNELTSIDKIGRINLDITALITLVSAVAHGGCYFRFKEKILSEQAAEEREDPVLPKLNAFIEGKELFACQTAVDSFQTILDTLGGQNEKKRASELLSRLTVVPDNPSFRATTIPNTGKIKDRSKIIFGTGDSLRAVTVTANSGFTRAAAHQGVTFAAFLHASRALTEQKEKTAEVIKRDS